MSPTGSFLSRGIRTVASAVLYSFNSRRFTSIIRNRRHGIMKSSNEVLSRDHSNSAGLGSATNESHSYGSGGLSSPGRNCVLSATNPKAVHFGLEHSILLASVFSTTYGFRLLNSANGSKFAIKCFLHIKLALRILFGTGGFACL
jgi:hypothetical protein